MSTPTDDWLEAPDLHGDLVRLVALRPEHAPGVLAAADDDAVFAHLSQDRPRDLAAAEALVATYMALPRTVPFAQLDARTGDVLGLTSFYEVAPPSRSLAIGYTWLARRAWRTGVNTEAKLMLLRHAFDALGAVRVVWHTDERNERSRAAIQRLGATPEGLLRKHKQRRDGTWRTTAQLAMTDDDWPAVRDRLTTRLARG